MLHAAEQGIMASER